ncbi:hypothetical protein SAMN05444354_109130 [Stigmatella aurantiaca]|uniref:Uncharacterized protein n=1 Tax=Stigmatella aurantiaca TaxID=41 RepID=A0A1H7TR71_STIAU|nr:hypothetical protein [Stigmatella aurantiaca]SEL87158.1 hypothetical protein SAMN05444354_109130 [Stigmatella aurantiaca]
MRDHVWFEMRDIRKRQLSKTVWIPLRAYEESSTGNRGYIGFEEEVFCLGSVAFPTKHRQEAEALGYSDIGLHHEQRSLVLATGYKPADVFQKPDGVDLGIDLVLDQGFDGAEQSEWHLHQDLVIALGLLREGDKWLCPQEGYIEVAHLTRNASKAPIRLEVRAENLSDYLAARDMALRVATYCIRSVGMEDASHVPWRAKDLRETAGGDRFEARVRAIHEGGLPFGATTAVFHIGRTDVDPEEDVPVFGAPDESNTRTRSWKTQSQHRKIFDVSGELWRTEWFEPATMSPRVRGDDIPSACSFITDSSGKRESANDLKDKRGHRWLWFRPAVIGELSQRRGGSLKWYTRDTGQVFPLKGYGIDFGVNQKELINAYASDIARLPEWQRLIWMGFNVAPDGKVSEELLDAQMRTKPAETNAPEAQFSIALTRLDAACRDRWKAPLLKQHSQIPNILRTIHRFRALAPEGLLALAKDMARLTVDSIDTGPLQTLVPLEKGEKRGSIKSLERALATLVPPEEARRLTGPLAGVYDLRLGDAHLPTADMNCSFTLAGIDPSVSTIRQAMQMMETTAKTFEAMSDVLEKNTLTPT